MLCNNAVLVVLVVVFKLKPVEWGETTNDSIVVKNKAKFSKSRDITQRTLIRGDTVVDGVEISDASIVQ